MTSNQSTKASVARGIKRGFTLADPLWACSVSVKIPPCPARVSLPDVTSVSMMRLANRIVLSQRPSRA